MSTSTTMRALVCPAVNSPLILRNVPIHTAGPGSIVIRVLATTASKSVPPLLAGHIFTFPTPLTPGDTCIGRVYAIGPDTTVLSAGQLVLCEPFIRARDDPTVEILWGLYNGPSDASKRFARENWAAGCMAQYVRAPLENTYALDEKVLLGRFRYQVPELLQLANMTVPFGGLRSVDIKAGERIIVAPATGRYSGAAVVVAVAMGAQVIAMGRNLARLEKMQALFPEGRVQIVLNSGDEEKDLQALKQWGPVDAYIDISPFGAAASTHWRSCFKALRQYGRACLMGPAPLDVGVNVMDAVWKNLTIRGQYMYSRDDVRLLIQMAEQGVLRLGKEVGTEITGTFGLEESEQAFKMAAEKDGMGCLSVITPWGNDY